MELGLASSSLLRLGESVPSRATLQQGLARLRERADSLALSAGEVIFHAGEEGDRVYLVQVGSVLAMEAGGGNGAQPVHVFRAGDIFGERALLYEHDQRRATCMAGSDGCELLSISRLAFQTEFRDAFVTAGPYRGRTVRAKAHRKTRNLDRDVAEFRGIRFARRPKGRFSLPELEPHPVSIVECEQFGPECAQVAGILIDQLAPPAKPKSHPSQLIFVHAATAGASSGTAVDEDCLRLNIVTPLTESFATKRFPVMVWIHGGGFITGSGSMPTYNARSLASKGVVVVTINYRLGPLGFLHGIPGVPSNLGLHDQLCALRWVKQCIHLFSGDANNITVFGESAGAMSIGCLLGMRCRRDESLFHKAILQSGAAQMVMFEAQALSMRDDFARHVAENLNLPSSASVTRTLLDQCPLEAIMKAAESMGKQIGKSKTELYGFLLPFQPVCAESSGVGVRDCLFEGLAPFVHVARGMANDVKIMAGVCNTEYALFMLENQWRRLLAKAKDSRAKYRELLVNTVASWACTSTDIRYRTVPGAKAQRIVDHFLPPSNNDVISEDEARSAFERLHSSWIFEVPTDQLLHVKKRAAAMASGSTAVDDAFAYRVHYPCNMAELGSPHAIDLPLVFGTYASDILGITLVGDTLEAAQVSDEMQKCWTTFARTGNPGFAANGPPRIFGGDRAGPPHPTFGVFRSDQERALWEGFQSRVELHPSVYAMTQQQHAGNTRPAKL